MKQKHLLLMLLLAFIVPWSATAQSPQIYTAYTATAGVSDFLDQGYPMLVDNSVSTKWCVGNFPGPDNLGLYIEFYSADPIIPTSYVLITADDTYTYQGRNPKSWTLKAKANPTDEWTTLATVTNDQVLRPVSYTQFEFQFDSPNNATYRYFRFDVSSIQSGGCFQLAELQLRAVIDPNASCIDLPYAESFDNMDQLPLCWDKINTSTSEYGAYPKVQSQGQTQYAHSGENYLCFRSANYSYSNFDPQDQYALLPILDDDISQIDVQLYARKWHDNMDATFTIGVIEDDDIGTFVPIETITPASNSYSEYNISLNSYNGTGNRIAIKMEKAASGSERAVFIDDIVLSQHCPMPTDPQVSGITHSSATLSWTGTTETYNLRYGRTVENWTEVNGITTPYTLEGLDEGTTYQWQVQAICNENNLSDWSDNLQFSTLAVNTFTTVGEWNDAGNWSYGVLPSENDDVRIDAHVTIPANCVATANNIEVTTEGSITINDGGQLKHNNAGVVATVKKHVDGYGAANANTNNGYILLAHPSTFGLSLASDESTSSYPCNIRTGIYDLYRWNGNGDSDGNEWINYGAYNPNTTLLSAGSACLYASQEDRDISFTNILVRKSDVNAQNSFIYKTPPTDDAPFSSWNLMGNPFVCDAYLVNEYENGVALPYYKMNTSGNGFDAKIGEAIAPMEGVFVDAQSENDNFVYFTRTGPAMPSSVLNISVAKASELAEEPTLNRGVSTLRQAQGSTTLDNAIIRFDGGQTLGKFSFREGCSKVYIPVGGKDLAVAQAEGTVGEMPLNFKAETNGTYTLSFTNEEVTFSYLHLIDNMTGADVDLLAGASTGSATYTFDARTTDYASRFRLVFATGSSTSSETFGFINVMGDLTIFGIEGEATLQVVDMLGHVVSTETFSGSYEKRLNVAPGVYMLRLIQGTDVKMQKLVVR